MHIDVHFLCVAEQGAHNTPFAVIERDGAGHVSYTGLDPSAAPLLDTTRIALAIQQSIVAKRGLHARVSCPTDIPRQQGLTFVCAAGTGTRLTAFEVKQVDSDGHVTYAAQ